MKQIFWATLLFSIYMLPSDGLKCSVGGILNGTATRNFSESECLSTDEYCFRGEVVDTHRGNASSECVYCWV